MIEKYARHYFHVSKFPIQSKTEVGDRVLFDPKKTLEINRNLQESDTPRVSVAPSIWQCVLAYPYNREVKGDCSTKLYVYRSARKLKCHYIPSDQKKHINDWKLTGERWLTKRAKFVLVCVVDTNGFPTAPVGLVSLVNKYKATIKELVNCQLPTKYESV